MQSFYTDEEDVLQLISLLKMHNIKKVVASPGSTNVTFIASIQNDPDFEIYSCVDERSAAYMACGLSEESGEPVVISCTGATAARNYAPGLTEAYYRKLPILAVTSSQPLGRVGQLRPQFTDRNAQFNDIVTKSVQIPYPYSEEERWSNNVKINSAILQLTKDGGGPVHINIVTNYSKNFTVKELPQERAIYRYELKDKLPKMPKGKICIFVGSHKKFSQTLQDAVDEFCQKYNAVVLCDQTSNYKGRYRVLGGLTAGQMDYYPSCRKADLVIHLGEISGAYYYFRGVPIWRVNLDGEVRDTFKSLLNVFQMDELDFFNAYNAMKDDISVNSYFQEWEDEETRLKESLPELPFSNAWLCQQTSYRLPENSVLYLGILNSLRSWNLFDVPNTVYSYSNVGGFGIDGVLSSSIGASLADKNKLYFCVLGDLSTFYDLNILGNHNISNNVRIIVVNNGTGFEMHCAGCVTSGFDGDIDSYMAAGRHFGNQSRDVLRHFSADLGFEYIKAENKKEYLDQIEYFVSPESHTKPILFEIFIDQEADNEAYNITRNLAVSPERKIKDAAKSLIGEKGYSALKNLIK